jgi:hypothetical protein
MTPRSRCLHQRSRVLACQNFLDLPAPRANADEKAESLAGPAQASRRDQGARPSVLTPSRSFDRQLLPFGTHLESMKTHRDAAKIPRPSRPPDGFSHAWAADNSGQRTRTLVPEPGRDSTWKEPPSTWARSRMPARRASDHLAGSSTWDAHVNDGQPSGNIHRRGIIRHAEEILSMITRSSTATAG